MARRHQALAVDDKGTAGDEAEQKRKKKPETAPMLHQFLIEHRKELIERSRKKLASRTSPRPTEEELQNGVPIFLTQLGDALQQDEENARTDGKSPAADLKIVESAAKHGHEMLNRGFTVGQVVHDYGDICQSVTELAVELDALIPTEEFRTLNRCLDNAIAEAVTEFGRHRDRGISKKATEQLGILAHELGNLVSSAMLSFQAMKSGQIGIGGSTGRLLEHSLQGLRDLIYRSLLEVRLENGATDMGQVRVKPFVEDVEVGAILEARNRAIRLAIAPIDPDLWVQADQPLLASALGNLLQNAFKFSRPKGQVVVSTFETTERVRIEIADECGGLPPGKAEELFLPFKQRGSDRTGMGLGLAISRRAVEQSGGLLSVRDVPGKGCVFVLDLPRVAPPEAGGERA